MGVSCEAASTRGVAFPFEADAGGRHAVGSGKAGGSHQPGDGVGKEDVVVVEEQQPLALGRRRRRVAGGAEIAVLLADDAPPARGELGLDGVEGGQGRRALAAVVDQDGVEVGVVLCEYAVDRHADQYRPLVMHEANGDPRRRGGGPGAGGEAFGGRVERGGLGVPALPDAESASEVAAWPHGAQRGGGQLGEPLAEGDAIRRDQGAGVVLGMDQLGRSTGGGGDERDAGLEALGDGNRGVLEQRGDDGEPSRLGRQVGHRLGGAVFGERAHLARPAASWRAR